MRDQSGEPYPRVRRAPASKLQVAATQPLSPPRGYAAHALVVRKERLADGVRAKFAVCSSRARRPASSLARCAWAARVAALAPKPKVLLSRARHGTREGSRATLAKRRTEAAQPLQGRSRFRDLSQRPWGNVSPAFREFSNTYKRKPQISLAHKRTSQSLRAAASWRSWRMLHETWSAMRRAWHMLHSTELATRRTWRMLHGTPSLRIAPLPFCCMPPLPWAFARAACPL